MGAWYAALPDDFGERIEAMRGCLAHVNTSADDFARRKQEEIDLEEAKISASFSLAEKR